MMGFGFNLFAVLILLPISGVFLILWASSKEGRYGKMLFVVWGGVICLILVSLAIQFFTTKRVVKRSDIYGEYIIDRTKFVGRQTDWQYNNFRFEITTNNKLIFYRINKDQILYSDTARVEFLEQYRNNRIRIMRDSTMHHIVDDEPTLYRNVWSFYYVFQSPKFGNVFFKKGKWESIH